MPKNVHKVNTYSTAGHHTRQALHTARQAPNARPSTLKASFAVRRGGASEASGAPRSRPPGRPPGRPPVQPPARLPARPPAQPARPLARLTLTDPPARPHTHPIMPPSTHLLADAPLQNPFLHASPPLTLKYTKTQGPRAWGTHLSLPPEEKTHR